MTERRIAPGGPGLPPRWTRGAKEGVGTAYSSSSRVWYTVAAGVLTEIFYPTIDTPQIRDLQFLVTDGHSFFHDERRNTQSRIDCVDEASLGFSIDNVAENRRYRLHKTVISHPHQDCVLMRTRVAANADDLRTLQLFVLCAPHLEGGGWHNNAEVVDTRGGRIFVMSKGRTWAALGCTTGFRRCSCGYVAVNDGWTDLHDNFTMDWEFEAVSDGNIAVTGEIDLSRGSEFTIGLGFGDTSHRAITNLLQSLVFPFEGTLERFRNEWDRTRKRFALVATQPNQARRSLYQRSVNVLLAHEDKRYPGAFIAALSIPWGTARSDEELGGYHLVWTRDLVQVATGLLAAGDATSPLRSLVYLAVAQRADGGFYQNFWIDGRAFWNGVQLDEVSFPIVLAWRLQQARAIAGFDPLPMVRAACGFLMREGPTTAQERWEECSGFSPSTLAIEIAALVCAAELFAAAGDTATAAFVLDYADFLESHVDRWTVTTDGTLVAGIARHYIRINPNVDGREDPNAGMLVLANQPPGGPYAYPAKEIVDAGFLELVRYGIRAPDDPVIVDSLAVIDAVLKTDTPAGPFWRRYNHDGYGQRSDGSTYRGWGVGRPWPLLTGERAHYELAARRDPRPLLAALERSAIGIGLLPEQIWDEPSIPEKLLWFGLPTSAAVPLAWAHAEYIKLLRSVSDGRVFDWIEPVHARYAATPRRRATLDIWSANRKRATIARDQTLRIIGGEPFVVTWTTTDWRERRQSSSTGTLLGVWYVDIVTAPDAARLRFTTANDAHEYSVDVTD
jgi:glucoamylase